MRSIQPARDIICGQWRECEWDEKSLIIEAPSTSDEVRLLLNAIPIIDFYHILIYCCFVVVDALAVIGFAYSRWTEYWIILRKSSPHSRTSNSTRSKWRNSPSLSK
jgi:hypothetical protein